MLLDIVNVSNEVSYVAHTLSNSNMNFFYLCIAASELNKYKFVSISCRSKPNGIDEARKNVTRENVCFKNRCSIIYW